MATNAQLRDLSEGFMADLQRQLHVLEHVGVLLGSSVAGKGSIHDDDAAVSMSREGSPTRTAAAYSDESAQCSSHMGGALQQEQSAVNDDSCAPASSPLTKSSVEGGEASLRQRLASLSPSQLAALALKLHGDLNLLLQQHTSTASSTAAVSSKPSSNSAASNATSQSSKGMDHLSSAHEQHVVPPAPRTPGGSCLEAVTPSNEALEVSNSHTPHSPALVLPVPNVLLDDVAPAMGAASVRVVTMDGSLSAGQRGHTISGADEGGVLPQLPNPPLIGIDQLSESDEDGGGDSSIDDGERHEFKTSRSVCSSTTVDGYETINEYLILDTVGEGQFGKVLLAHHEKLGEPRAIKVLPKKAIRKRRGRAHPQSSTSGDGIGVPQATAADAFLMSSMGSSLASQSCGDASIRNEIAIMKKLRHRNIVPLYEVIDDDEQDSLYLVMQFAENGTLLTLDERGHCTPLPETQVKKYLRQLIAGLSYLERHHICHNDLKPSNILVTKNDDILIADFGLSEMIGGSDDDVLLDADSDACGDSEAEASPIRRGSSSVTTAGGASPATSRSRSGTATKAKLRGTPAFMCPEALSGESIVGSTADVWSLGVVTYCMLWGKLPFSVEGWRETIRSVVESDARFPEDADPTWVDLVAGMLHKDPAQRTTLSALRRHPVLRDGRRTPSVGSLTPMTSSFTLSPEDLASAFTMKAPTKHDFSSPQRVAPHPPSGSRRVRAREHPAASHTSDRSPGSASFASSLGSSCTPGGKVSAGNNLTTLTVPRRFR